MRLHAVRASIRTIRYRAPGRRAPDAPDSGQRPDGGRVTPAVERPTTGMRKPGQPLILLREGRRRAERTGKWIHILGLA